MGKSDNNISQTPEGKPRPSLFNAGTTATDHNILDAMVRRPNTAPAARPRRLIWLLVPLLLAVGWVIATQLKPAPAPKPEVQAAVTTLPPAFTTATATTPTAVVSAATAKPASPFNALETAGSTAAQSGVPAAGHAAATQGLSPIDPPTPHPSTLPPSLPPKADTSKPASSTNAKAAAAKPAASQKNASTKATSNAGIKTASRPVAPASKKSGGSDPDVELLSAIMKHLGDERGTSAGSVRSAQTIAELVKSCSGKDAIENLLCQRRICEGSWGKAQACPASLAPKKLAGQNTPVKAAATAPTFITEANPAPARR